MALNILYTAHAKATGGRNGHTQTEDGQVSHDLSVPKAMGGPGKPNTTTPEDLFAAGYAACFGSACDFVAKSMLKVGLTARISGLSQADAEKLVAQAHQVCPYSNATRNNVEVTLKTEVV